MSTISSSSSTSSPTTIVNTNGTVAPVTSSVGPVSGINYQALITALEASQQAQVTDLQNDITKVQGQETGYQTLEANLAPATTALQSLAQPSTFEDTRSSCPTRRSST